jgi:farnesyl-diphosphate farnesyltransferase
MSGSSHDLLGRLLRDVSRSFYLTLRVLPGRIRAQISLAYLLARTTDTIADTALVPAHRRLEVLRQLGQAIQGTGPVPAALAELADQQGMAAERQLLARFEEALTSLASFSSHDQRLIREVLAVITSGQELDLTRFAAASRERIVALQTDQEFDDYTYRVAGCVGEFWTRLCRAHLFPRAELDDAALLEKGIRFGKGLQSVNILRDLAVDLRQGRCYFPEDRLRLAGLTPTELLDPSNEARFRPAYDLLLDQTQTHLKAGSEYTLSLPYSQARVRLACAWPILIGSRTVSKLRFGNVLSPDRTIKVNRRELRWLIAKSVILYPWPTVWKRLLEGRRR